MYLKLRLHYYLGKNEDENNIKRDKIFKIISTDYAKAICVKEIFDQTTQRKILIIYFGLNLDNVKILNDEMIKKLSPDSWRVFIKNNNNINNGFTLIEI